MVRASVRAVRAAPLQLCHSACRHSTRCQRHERSCLGAPVGLQVPYDCRSTAHRCLPFAHRCDAICTHCVRALASVYTSKLPRGLLTKTFDRCSKPG